MARWFRIHTPDWSCEHTGCHDAATWEQDRTPEQIKNRELAELRCDKHLPADAIKLDAEKQPEQKAHNESAR